MSLRPFPPLSPATRPVGSAVADLRAHERVQRARAWAFIGAGYLLFLGAHAGAATDAGPGWRAAALTVGALLMVAAGMRAWRGTCRAPDTGDADAAMAGGVAPEHAAAFVGRLYTLGPAGWALVVARTRDHVDARAGARAVLCTVVTDLGLDGVERRLAQSVAAVVRSPGAERVAPGARAIARTTALHAALAVLVRPALPARDFDALYAPFAPLIPAPASHDALVA